MCIDFTFQTVHKTTSERFRRLFICFLHYTLLFKRPWQYSLLFAKIAAYSLRLANESNEVKIATDICQKMGLLLLFGQLFNIHERFFIYDSVHINVIQGKHFVDFLKNYLSYKLTQYQFSHPHFKSFHVIVSDFYSDLFNS